jgi:hypothetical protein
MRGISVPLKAPEAFPKLKGIAVEEKPQPETPAAAWKKTADPLASAAYMAATRQGGREWRAAMAAMPSPATSIADHYGAKP